MSYSNLDHLFTLDPKQAYIHADGVINPVMGQMNRMLGDDKFQRNAANYLKLENWFESRFHLSPEDHSQSFKDLFGLDLRMLDKPIDYHSNNTYFLDKYLYFKPRYTFYIINCVNKILVHYGIQIDDSRQYQLLLSCFLRTAKLTLPRNIELKTQYLSIHDHVNSLMDCFLHMYNVALHEDKSQLYFHENLQIYKQLSEIDQKVA